MEIKKYPLEPDRREVFGAGEQDDIYLSIKIGNGQIGGNKVLVGEKLLAKGGLTEPILIGRMLELKNKDIYIETNVLDVNSFTNVCVFATTFYNQENKVLFTNIDKGEAPESGIASFNGKYVISILVLFFFISSINSLMAQSTTNDISFQNLETPASPGFILLDNTPSSIERPTTPQGFGLSALGFFQGTGGAIEFAPFWLMTHPKLTADEMYNNEFPILYNVSISAATVKSDSANYLAGGIRTRLFQSYTQEQIAKLDSLKSQLELHLSDLDTSGIEELQKKYSDIIEKPIFTIDIATAMGAGSQSNSFNELKLNRWAAWLSFNYRPTGNDFYVTALTRYINNEKFEQYIVKANLVDLGTRLNWDISKFCLSLEYLQRVNLKDSNFDSYRIAVISSYKLSDNFFVISTFGKNFTDMNNIIALAGVNFGFSKNKVDLSTSH